MVKELLAEAELVLKNAPMQVGSVYVGWGKAVGGTKAYIYEGAWRHG